MTVATASSFRGQPQRHRWTGKEFDRASEAGLFDEQRVELINGEILEMPPMNDPAAQGIQLANYALLGVFPREQFTISIQCPMRLGESRPFPDLVVVNGTPREVAKHPTTAILIVEVSDTTLEYDQGEKAELYAANMLPEYWIVNLKDRSLEVRTDPSPASPVGPQYKSLRQYRGEDIVSPLGAPKFVIKVADLLP